MKNKNLRIIIDVLSYDKTDDLTMTIVMNALNLSQLAFLFVCDLKKIVD
jgi:predicted transcriptional regulator